MSDATPRHLVVLGLMASGKSTVGTGLALRLDRPLIDNDRQLDRIIGTTAVAYAEERGLDALHQLELEVLRTSLDSVPAAVITAAASVGDRPELPEVLAGHHVVWLDVDPATLARRVPPVGDHRPYDADALTQLEAQHRRRSPNFRAAADVVVTWHHETPAELVDAVLRDLGLTGA